MSRQKRGRVGLVPLIVVLLLTLFPAIAWAVPPPNDLCPGAEVVPPAGPFPYLTAVTADITDATIAGDPAATCVAGTSRGIWYSFTPSTTALYTIGTCADFGTGSTVDDTVLAVFASSDGTCGGAMTQVSGACDDDSCTSEAAQSVLTTTLSAGTTYYILSYQYGALATPPTVGNTAVQLRITQVILPPPPSNDVCGAAEVIPPAGPFPYLTAITPDVGGATATGDPPAPSCTANVTRSIWYSFTPSVSGHYSFSSCADAPTGSTLDDNVIAIYTSSDGTCNGAMTQMPGACDNDGCLTENFQAVSGTFLTAGTTYYILSYVWGSSLLTAGNTAVQLRVTQTLLPPPPSNDLCGGAEVIPPAGPFPYLTSITPDVGGATAAGDPPAPSCAPNATRSIWYTFTPSVTANYTFSSCADAPTGSTVDDNAIGIYTSSDGTCNGAMTQVPGACDNDTCVTETLQAVTGTLLNAGTTYYILSYVNGTNLLTAGNTAVQLRVTQTIPPSNDTCDTPAALPLNTTVSGTLANAGNQYQASTAAPNCYTLPAGPPAPIGQTATSAVGRDVVYQFDAPANASYSFKAVNAVNGGNLVVYTASDCPKMAGINTLGATCLGASNRNSNTTAFNASEEVMCVPMTAGQSIFVYVDESTVTATGGAFLVEATECVREVEPNDTTATANTPICGMEGSIAPAGNADFFALGNPAAGTRVFAMADGVAGNSNDFDMRITTATDTLEYDDGNNGVPWGSLAPNIAGRALTGVNAFIRMSHFSAATQSEPYRLYSVLQPPGAGLGGSSATDEVEPNANLGEANAAGNLFFAGTIGPTGGAAGDLDRFRFCAEAGDVIFLSIDGDPLRNLTPMDATPSLFDQAGTQLVGGFTDTSTTSSNTSGAGSLTATTPNSPADIAVFRAPYSGTFYAGIQTLGSGVTSTGDYLYSISLNCQTGNQLVSNLSITAADSPDPVTAGQSLSFALSVNNTGAKTVLDPVVTDTLPTGTTYAGFTAPAGWTCSHAAGVVTCRLLGCMVPNTPVNITIDATVNACVGNGAFLTNTATVSAKTADSDMNDNTAVTTTVAIDPGTCDDGSACTQNDVCGVGGLCAGTPILCDDGNACTADFCDVAMGCQAVQELDGTSCSDGSACTQNDTCQAGACTAGPALVCDDGNSCTDEICNAATGCVYTNNVAPCDDGNACTTIDACTGGACVGAVPVICNDGIGCTADACNPSTGACEYTPILEGQACNDGDACTSGEVCTSGVCGAGNAVNCDDGNSCTDEVCNSATGCVYTNNILPCDDGSACTTGDTCSAGACVGSSISCNDGNGCTDDSCNPASGCVFTDNVAPCSDGNACTTNDTCSNGACAAGLPLSCDDANGCTDDSCNPATGCVNVNNTLPCSDGSACTTNDTCSAGACVGGAAPNCNDGNGCTDDSCNPATGCVNINNTAPCSDGSACTTNDTCSAGACVGGPAPNCNDGNGCTDDSCNPATGCVNTNNTAPCSDGSACTTNDTCSAGACVGGAAPNCDDANGCTDDSCNPATGCVNTNNTAPCSDGSACTTNDTCSNGACVPGPGLTCNDNNGCTDDSCSPATGCVFTNNTAPCSDSNACTTTDTCSNGACVAGPALVCNDANGCTDDSCNPATGCVFTNNSAPCNDGSACTQTDTCSNGACAGGNPVVCGAPPSACHSPGVCDPADGICDYTLVGADTDADTVGDTCDNCPNNANTNQADGDSDTVGDVCDNCAANANTNQNDLDNDGLGDACDPDIDGDGVQNTEELALGTNPSNADTDGDTIADCTELCDANDGSCLMNGVCTLTAAAADTDGDGTLDALDTDSDADGLTDAAEAGDTDLATAPVDTNGDGVPDYREPTTMGTGGMGGMAGMGGMGGTPSTGGMGGMGGAGGAGGQSGLGGASNDYEGAGNGILCGLRPGATGSSDIVMLLLALAGLGFFSRRRRAA